MLGGKRDWLPARAEPLWFNAYRPTNEHGEEDDFAANLEVQWRIHIDGRTPYEFEEKRRSCPLWIIKGEYRGRRWFNLRLRASQGLLREVGVPCRVHPEKPHKIDLDSPRAYEEHQPIWDRMDAVSKGVTARREGPLGKLLAPIEYARLPKFTPQEQQAIDREIDAEVARQDAATGVGATAETVVDTATLQAESEFIAAQQKEGKRLRKHGRKAYATVIELSGPTGPASWLYTVRLEIHESDGTSRIVEHSQGMNYAMTQLVKPGARVRVRVDPLDPNRVAFEIH